MELITTTFYNLKFQVLLSSGKWCYIFQNIILILNFYLDKIVKLDKIINHLLCSYLINACSHADTCRSETNSDRVNSTG